MDNKTKYLTKKPNSKYHDNKWKWRGRIRSRGVKKRDTGELRGGLSRTVETLSSKQIKRIKYLNNKTSILDARDFCKNEDFDRSSARQDPNGCPYIQLQIKNYEILKDSGAEIRAISEKYVNLILLDDKRTPVLPVNRINVHNVVGEKPTKKSLKTNYGTIQNMKVSDPCTIYCYRRTEWKWNLE